MRHTVGKSELIVAGRTRKGRSAALELRTESGQTIVEFAFVLPILVGLMLAAVEFGIIFKDWINVTDTARVAARAGVVARFGTAPVDPPCTAAQKAVTAANDGLTMTSCTTTATDITVTVEHPWSINLPLLPAARGGQLTSTVTEKLE
jgi:Flp pilus assembly protein TadG